MTELIATKQKNRVVSIYHILISAVLVIFMFGCGGHVYHVVESGETLYSIGWLYGHDYRQIAQWNKLASHNAIRKGQRLRVAPPTREGFQQRQAKIATGVTKRNNAVADTPDVKALKRPSGSSTGEIRKRITAVKRRLRWQWPVKNGKPVHGFNAKDPGKRGLDFTGREGQAIYSAEAGSIVYSGEGLPRYGKLIIVKHSDEYLSAYAHNKQLLVREGEKIKPGQRIASMGRNTANKVLLHFEIRRNGKPVDPLMYLPKREK